jgi:hypothetical protein
MDAELASSFVQEILDMIALGDGTRISLPDLAIQAQLVEFSEIAAAAAPGIQCKFHHCAWQSWSMAMVRLDEEINREGTGEEPRARANVAGRRSPLWPSDVASCLMADAC